MVAKGRVVNRIKSRRLEERKDRTIYVHLKRKLTLDKALVEDVVKAAHAGIERVYLPRQRVPTFFFVLCASQDVKEGVKDALNSFNKDLLGPLKLDNVIVKERKVPEKTRKGINPLTLVLEMIPKELTTDEIKCAFPKCVDVYRFNDRRCYVYFSKIPDASEAFQRLKQTPLCGHAVTAKFDRVVKKDNTKSVSTTLSPVLTEEAK